MFFLRLHLSRTMNINRLATSNTSNLILNLVAPNKHVASDVNLEVITLKQQINCMLAYTYRASYGFEYFLSVIPSWQILDEKCLLFDLLVCMHFAIECI